MGEAKRRKQLDPTWGKPKIYDFIINGSQVRLESKIFLGTLTLNDNDFEVDVEIESTNDEADFLELMLSMTLPKILEKYNYEKTTYTVVLDLSKLVTQKTGLIKIYPAYWNYDILRLREFRSVQINLKQFIDDCLISEEIPVDTPMKQSSECDNQVERTTPAEHLRRAHKRRVAYGKGRAYRKWVEIAETVVNAR